MRRPEFFAYNPQYLFVVFLANYPSAAIQNKKSSYIYPKGVYCFFTGSCLKEFFAVIQFTIALRYLLTFKLFLSLNVYFIVRCFRQYPHLKYVDKEPRFINFFSFSKLHIVCSTLCAR